MTKTFWKDFWEGANPLYWLVWALYGVGRVLSLMLHWDRVAGYLYPAYTKMMLWSYQVQSKAGLSGPWPARKDN